MDALAPLFLTTLVPLPPDHTTELQEILSILQVVCHVPHPNPGLWMRHFSEDENTFGGKDVFSELADNRYSFYQITGETPETFLQLEALVSLPPCREHSLSSRNRLFLFIIWLRMYPTYSFLANLFCISVSVVGTEVTNILPMFSDKLKSYVVWPTLEEWRNMRGTWPKIPSAVGAIDGTSHRIYRPKVEPQELYYSGYRHSHCIHSQVVIDANGIIRYVSSGYPGHLNDAQTYTMMRQIGVDLSFPDELVLLGDKIYPNRGAIMTPYTAAQLSRKRPNVRKKCRKLNSLIRSYRIRVEHTIAELKTYKAVSSVWRHPRSQLSPTVNACAALVCRRKAIGLTI